MGAGIGETEGAVVLLQQPGDRLGIVVGDDAVDPDVEVGRLEGQVEDDVERLRTPLSGQVGHPAAGELGVSGAGRRSRRCPNGGAAVPGR